MGVTEPGAETLKAPTSSAAQSVCVSVCGRVCVWDQDQNSTPRTVPARLAEACLSESGAEAPGVRNDLPALPVGPCGRPASPACVQLSRDVGGVCSAAQ